ncbi:MAG: hypothetical protein CHACPFDD_03435 [Phycisphaerae bacterium]|nr:hypothetical protein [Phycisphaerae bacterium]
MRQAWAARYDGPASGPEYALDIEVDRAGAVFVTGYSPGVGSGDDFATAKFDTTGRLLWVQRYNGPGNSFDYAFAVAVDAEGNAVVAGYSAGTTTYGDIAVLKYDPAGNVLWERRYDQAHQSDIGYDVEVDAVGNVYVAGWSSDGDSHGFRTLKYDADGNLLWERRYDGPGDDDAFDADLVYDLELDAAGNVYVTGLSEVSETDSDAATVKYDSDGNLAWVRRFDLAGGLDAGQSLAVDGAGRVCVAGWGQGAGTNYDALVLLYDADGVLAWSRVHDGAISSEDVALDVAFDGDGNVVVAGSSDTGGYFGERCLTLKYAADGTPLWERLDGYGGYGTELAVDADGVVCVAGFSFAGWDRGLDSEARAIAPDGTLLWEQQFNGDVSGNDTPFAIALDAAGDVLVGGWSLGNGSGLDYFIVKYSRFDVGDLNCDGMVDGFDIPPFLLVLTDRAAYAVVHPSCDAGLADVNGDGGVDGFDIDGFVAMLTGG